MPQAYKCSQCLNVFTMAKLPRKLPNCEHNICECCLKEIIDSKQDLILCGFCSSMTRKQDIRIFSLNTGILLSMSEAPVVTQSLVNQEDNQLLVDLETAHDEVIHNVEEEDQCRFHKVPLDIICISCRVRICPHCALFGNHKQHRFKRQQDLDREIEEKMQIFKQIRHDKKKSFQNKQFNIEERITAKIQTRKQQLKREVEKYVQRLILQLKGKQEAVLLDIQNIFAQVQEGMSQYNYIDKFTKIKNKFQKWQKNCVQTISELQTSSRPENRLRCYYEGPLQIVTEGYIFLQELQKCSNQAMNRVENSLSKIVMEMDSQCSNVIDKSVRVCRGKFQRASSRLTFDEQNQETNPFLDCTSSDIMLGCNSSVYNNTSIEADLSTFSKTYKQINSPLLKNNKKIQTESNIKLMRSIDKTKNIINTPAIKKTNAISPRVSTYVTKKVPQVGLARSPFRMFKSPTAKDIPLPEPQIKPYNLKQPQKLYLQFTKNTLSDFFDISQCNLPSDKVVEYVHRARRLHRIKGLKICNNRLTTAGFQKMTQFLQGVGNVNMANNLINQGIFQIILKNRDRLISLKIINLAHNPINMDKKASMKMQQVKKLGIMVTL